VKSQTTYIRTEGALLSEGNRRMLHYNNRHQTIQLKTKHQHNSSSPISREHV